MNKPLAQITGPVYRSTEILNNSKLEMKSRSDANPVKIYCTAYCPFCSLAERLFRSKGIRAKKLHVDHQPRLRSEMEKLTGQHTVPQILIGNTHIGSYHDLVTLNRSGELDTLLTKTK